MIHEELDALARPAALCAFCPKMCRSACPVSEVEGREAVTPWAKMSILHLAREGSLSMQDPDVAEIMQSCTGCGACKEQCAHGVPVGDLLFFARGTAIHEENAANPSSVLKSEDLIGEFSEKVFRNYPTATSGKIAYFAGVHRLKQEMHRQQKKKGLNENSSHSDFSSAGIAEDLLAYEMAFGEKLPLVQLPKDVFCSGYSLLANGAWGAFVDHQMRLTEALKKFDVIVTSDEKAAHTLTTMRQRLLPAEGAHEHLHHFPDVKNLVEVLATRADAFANKSLGLKVRYHDACCLGRRAGIYDAPRLLLQKATGQAPVEFARSQKEADCCGAGGLYEQTHPKQAAAMAQALIKRDPFHSEDIDVTVTASPSCRTHFEKSKIPALDVIDVLLGRVPFSKAQGKSDEL